MKKSDIMSREQARKRFARLIKAYGIQWRFDVPGYVWTELAELNKVLSEQDRREIFEGRA